MASIFKARYDEHHTGLTNEFFKWYQNGTHIDVTIHAGGQRVRAHKLVLAANSPFFNGVFSDTKTENSHLYFTDVPIQSMKSLIEYMYSGDLVVEREFLPACLQLADSLRVKGISGLGMEDVITEPAPVSAKMHSLINTLMQQYPPQQPIEHQTPKREFSRNQKKKLSRKSRKMLGRVAGPAEKAVPRISSKLVFKRIKNTNGYKLEKIRSNKVVDKNVFLEHDASRIENQQQNPKELHNDLSVQDRPKPIQIESPNNGTESGIESEIEEKNSSSEAQIDETKQEMLADNEKEDLLDARNMCLALPYNDEEEQADKFNDNQCKTVNSECFNSRFDNDIDILERTVSKVVAVDSLISVKRENFSRDEMVQAIVKDSTATSLKSTLREMKNIKARLKKDDCKVKRRKRVPKLLPPVHLDKEFEKLFGDNYFGIVKKEEITDTKIEDSSNIETNENEECDQKPLENISEKVAENDVGKKKNGKGRRTPICPPPEDISQNGKSSFGCAICKRVYTHKSNYRRHYMVFHKRCAEAVFECPMCNKKFTRSDNRTHHIRRIHGYGNNAALVPEEHAPLYICPICKKAFTRISIRSLHLVEEHGINPDVVENGSST